MKDKIFHYQSIISHRTSGNIGCPNCNELVTARRAESHEEFVRKAKEIHGDKYSYPEQYKNDATKINILCNVKDRTGNIHGIFPQHPSNHKHGSGCPKCDPSSAQRLGGHNEFVARAIEIHGDKYTYPEMYIGCATKISIHCSKIGKDKNVHGLFRQLPNSHIGVKTGCPKCANERTESAKVSEVNSILYQMGYIEDVTMFSEWVDEERLRDKGPLRIDKFIFNKSIEIPENLCQETDGAQHFRQNGYTRNRQDFIDSLRRDFLKDQYCLTHGLSIVRIPYNLKNCRFWLETAISMCKAGQRVYFTYKHFYDEIIKYMTIPPDYLIAFIECPPLKFRRTK